MQGFQRARDNARDCEIRLKIRCTKLVSTRDYNQRAQKSQPKRV
jgi:hypothetical protein